MAWQIDSSHSSVNFSVRHMMLSTARGHFATFSGTLDFDESNPAAASVDVKIDVASINTKDEKRDGHLKSGDFFDADKFPHMAFKSTGVQSVSGNTAKLTGDLTIKDVTKPVVLDVEYHGQAKAPWGTTSAGFSASTKINREDWGLGWNAPLETGGVLVGKDVKIELELEAVKQ